MNMTQMIKASRNLVKYSALGLAAAAMLGAASVQAASNDNFADAILLSGASGIQTGADNIDATLETGEPACGANNTVWFKWVCSANGQFFISTLGSLNAADGEWDVILGIYTGSSIDTLTPLGTTPKDTVLEENMTVAVTAGTTYYIQTAGYNNEVATNIKLTWLNTPDLGPQAQITDFGPGAVINQITSDILWTVPVGTDVTSIFTTFTLSTGAKCYSDSPPATEVFSGTEFDFSMPVHFFVKSSDEAITNDYTVTVNVAQLPVAAGLACWFDAASGTTTNGNGVLTWADLSGNGHNATRANGTLNIAANAINGLPAVQFAGNAFASMSGTMYSKTQFIVTKMNGGDWGAWMGSRTRGGYMWNQNGNCWDQNVPSAVSKNGTALAGYPFYLGDNRNEQYMILKIVGNDNNTSQRLYELGRQEGWYSLNNYMAEIIVFDRVLSTDEENLVGGYLTEKYGLTSVSSYPALPLAVSVTSPAQSQGYPSGASVTASATVIPVSGTGPYSVQFYKKAGEGAFASVGSPVTGAGPAFVLPLGVLADNTYQIYAVVTDSAPGAATSVTNTFTVQTAVPTATTLATSGTPSTYGDSVTFTATINPMPSGGKVQFYDDGNPIGLPVAVNTGDGTAQYSTPLLGVPTNLITAVYSGHGIYLESTASALAQAVEKAVLTVTADNAMRPPGAANPTFTYKITGYQNGENAASAGITGAPGLTTLADADSPSGEYEITCTVGDLASPNYSFTALNGVLKVQVGAPPVSSGMACWFDASVGITEDGSGVLTWNDLSVNAHHATRASGTPIRVADQLNGKPAVQFRADYFNLAEPMLTMQQYLVLKSPTPFWTGGGTFLGPSNVRIYDMFGGLWGGAPGCFGGFWTDPPPVGVSRNGVVIDPQWGNNFAYPINPITEYMLLKINVNTNQYALAGAGNPQSYQLGRSADVGTVDFDVCEIIAYDHVLSAEDEAKVGGFLANKYGMVTAYTDLTPQAQIRSFGLPGAPAATINEAAKTITFVVPSTANVTALAPVFTLSADATCDHDSGTAYNFSSPVHYIVNNGTVNSDYTVTVNRVAPSGIINLNIDSTTWPELVGPAGGLGTTWNSRSTSSGSGLLDSTGFTTGVGYTSSGSSWDGPDQWGYPNLHMLKRGYRNFDISESNWQQLIITGLAVGKRYDLHIASANCEVTQTSKGVWSTPNDTTTPGDQPCDNTGGINGDTWVEGNNYVVFKDVKPDGSGQIIVNGHSLDGYRLPLSGFQIVELPPKGTVLILW